ncbi:CU044_5270 family protein [Streptomyces sp. NPDC059445]|uniref:CU044_5270 family protein n=1 Tax=Streptomyces sp. NPDC059445 TaxID=3346832 RepID=UPI00367B8A03
MDDLTRVRELAADQAGPTDRARAVAFARLRSAIGEETGDAGGALARQRPLSRRLVFRAAIAATGTAAVAGTTLLVAGGEDGGGPRLPALNAAQVLRRAADRSRADTGGMPIPRDDQYMYSKEVTHRTYDRGARKLRLVDEYWLSVDGSKTSRYVYNGRVKDEVPDKHSVIWPPLQYAKLEKWPTDPDELLKLFGHGRTTGKDAEADMFAYIQACIFLRGPRVFPPGLQAAAFEAVAKLPAVKIDHDRVDALGRHGIGISYPRIAFGLVFDPETYAYLGIFERGHSDKNGGFSQVRAVVSQGVVDRIGRRPTGRGTAGTTPSASATPSPSPSDPSPSPSTSAGSTSPSPSPSPTSVSPSPGSASPSATSATPSPSGADPR